MKEVINIVPVLPEITLAIAACVVLLAGAFTSKKTAVFLLGQIGLLVAAIVTVVVHGKLNLSHPVYAFHNSFVLDPMAVYLKFFILLCVFIIFIYTQLYNRDRGIAATEFYVLAMLATVGMMLLVSAHSLLTLFLGVELLSLPTYAMVAMWRDRAFCSEAAMKYFIMGALATAVLLYGFSMLFGATQSLDIAEIAHHLEKTPLSHNYLAIFGLVFTVTGLAFKLGVVPFHMWVPDVFEGAPTSITLFIATAPKIAIFGMMIRLLVGMLPSLHVHWQEMLIILSVLSMGLGNCVAIVQTKIKRLLAYSSIAHAGYTLLGIICVTPRGYAAAMFYTLTYSLMTLGAFGVVLLLNRAGFEVDDIRDMQQLNNTHPWLAFVMLVVLFSLAGIPPLVGFIAKVGLLEALIDAHLVWLAVVAIVFAIIGAFYYLRVVKVMYFERSEQQVNRQIVMTPAGLCAISLNGLAILMLGIFPGLLFSLCHLAFVV